MTTTRSRPLPLLDESPAYSPASDHRQHDSGFGALETSRGRLPLSALDVAARIDGLLSQVTVCQTFVNVTNEPLEATYIFPLPDRAGVTDFRMEVAGRLVEGVLKKRGQARREYTQAIQQGRRASIAEEERPGVFSLRVGNLMPGDVATVQLTMAGILPYRDGEVTFRFPLVVAPRYIPGIPLCGPSVGRGTAVDTTSVPDASRISPPVLLAGFPNPVRLTLTVELYEPAADLRVSLFTVLGEDHGHMRRLTLRPGERLDRDFILRFHLGGDSVRSSLSLHPDADENGEGTFALSIVPPAAAVGDPHPQRARDVVLLLDRSGSMEGWKIVAARRALARMIDTLVDTDRFAVFAFDDRIESPPPATTAQTLIAATDRHRFQAVEFLAKVESRGGTEITQPLDRAVTLLDQDQHDRDLILVLVTDGQVGNEDHVLSALGARLSGIRVFTLGIDQAVNDGFLRRLTELGQGDGTCELVESEDRLDAVMSAMHHRIASPVVMDVCLEPASKGFRVLAETSVPDRPPSLFAGSPLMLLGRYRGRPSVPVEVRGRSPGGEAWREMVSPAVRPNPAIAAAWARGQVRQLEDRYAAGLGDRAELEKTITATSLRFGVMCRFTAYVAVDQSSVVNEGGEAHQITQPVDMPAGWSEAMLELAECPATQIDWMKLMVGGGGLPRETVASDWNLSDETGLRYAPNASAAPRSRPASAPAAVPPPPPSTPEDRFRQLGLTLFEKTDEDAYSTSYRGQDLPGQPVHVLSFKKPFTLAGARAYAQIEKLYKGLKHSAIVPVQMLVGDSRTGTVLGVISDYVAAPKLSQRLTLSDLIELREGAFFVLILADALEYAARKHMIHGDLSPRKILVGDDGEPRITGFGLTRIGCGPDVSCATVRVYVAPEILRTAGAHPTPQSDVYSLGVILYQLSTGMLPNRDPGNNQPQSPRGANSRVPVELEAICLKAIATAPEARYPTAAELAADLRMFLGVKKPAFWERSSKR